MRKTILTLAILTSVAMGATNNMGICEASMRTTVKYDSIYKSNKTKANSTNVIAALNHTINNCKGKLDNGTIQQLKGMREAFIVVNLSN